VHTNAPFHKGLTAFGFKGGYTKETAFVAV